MTLAQYIGDCIFTTLAILFALLSILGILLPRSVAHGVVEWFGEGILWVGDVVRGWVK